VEDAGKPVVKRSNRREPLELAYFGLILFMIVYFARPEDWVPGLASVPLARITGLLILLALTFSFSQIRWHMPQEVIFLALLVVQLWLAALFSPVWRGGAVNLMLDFTKVLPLVIVIYAAVRSMKRLRSIIFVQAASISIIAIVSILDRHISAGRLQGALSTIYGDPNDLALAIDLSLPLCLILALTTVSRWKKITWTIAMLAMIYAVALTASRAGAIALAVAAVVCLWRLGVGSRRFYLLLLVPVALIAFWLLSGNVLRERFNQTSIESSPSGQATAASGSAQQRKELFMQSLRVTVQHPLFGVGPGNFVVVSGVWHVTHNTFTQLSAEGGLPALVLYVLVFWYGLANLRHLRKYRMIGKEIRLFSMALEASLSAFLVGSLFLSDAYQVFTYCLVAYTSVLRLIALRNRRVSAGPPLPPMETTQVAATVWQ